MSFSFIILIMLFLGVVLGISLSICFANALLLFIGIASYIGIMIWLHCVNSKKTDKEISEQTKQQQKYDNEYGIISYLDKTK